jgi:hypothetical protein
MTWSCPIFRRWLLVSGIWLVLTGGTVVSCNSDPSGLGSGNRPPVAADSFYTLAENGTLTAFMKATDPDGDRLTFRIVAGPRIGTLRDVDSSTGQFTYLPGEIGTDSFSFRASDGRLESNTAVVTIQIVEATGRQSASKSSGARQVADDPLVPGAVLVLWDDPAGTLQRIYLGQPVTPQTLGQGLAGFAVNALSPGRMTAFYGDGSASASLDGGSEWRATTADRSPCGPTAQTPESASIGRPCPLLPSGLAPLEAAGQHPSVAGGDRISLLSDAFRDGGWWLAVGGVVGTEVLYSRDDGLHWQVILDLSLSDLRLTSCQDGNVCLLSRDGTQLWRFPTGY